MYYECHNLQKLSLEPIPSICGQWISMRQKFATVSKYSMESFSIVLDNITGRLSARKIETNRYNR